MMIMVMMVTMRMIIIKVDDHGNDVDVGGSSDEEILIIKHPEMRRNEDQAQTVK